jgi:solute carrier family 39 (zinc transporter), member 1/2/3
VHHSLWFWQIVSLVVILVVTLVAGAYPFLRRAKLGLQGDFQTGEAIAAGVFLGAGLIHMLADSAREFASHQVDYPVPFLLCGGIFLLLLFLEHIGREVYCHSSGERSPLFAVLAMVMLSVHAFLAGAALGLSQHLGLVIIIFFAVLAHKWAASFSLAIHLLKSKLPTRTSVCLFLVFALMVPLGILFGEFLSQDLSGYPLITPVFMALAAGTFLYLGTLHGLSRAVMVKQCCDLRHFFYVVAGFSVMAIVAIWV